MTDMADDLLTKLKRYGGSDYYPLHMPGHKRRISHFEQPFAIDITEIDGFDDLHHAQGILREAQQRAARLYGADETYYLVNGSTCGILAAVAAAVPRGGRILMARNSHRSVYNAVFLNDLHAEYLCPPLDPARGIAGSILPEDVRRMLRGDAGAAGKTSQGRAGAIEEMLRGNAGAEGKTSQGRSGAIEEMLRGNAGAEGKTSQGRAGAIEEMLRGDAGAAGETSRGQAGAIEEMLQRNPGICAVVVTSPTYDGVVSDIRAIAEEVHRAGAVLIVDEAQGAHFGMHPYFPESALSCGADIVVNSLHKTLPSLTQTALLHVRGDRADREKLRRYLDIYQTSSPSYVLMAGMDACVNLLERQGRELFDEFVGRLEKMRDALGQMRVLHLVDGRERELQVFGFDRSRILISLERSTMTGPELAQILRWRYHLEPEMAAADYVTAIMTVADGQEGFDRLTEALLETDAGLQADLRPAEPETCRDAGKAEAVRRPGTAEPGSAERTAADWTGRPAGSLRGRWPRNEEAMSIREARERPAEPVLLRESAGRVSAEYIYLYPPGIPLVVPGERISGELLRELEYDQSAGLRLQGLANPDGTSVRVVRKE